MKIASMLILALALNGCVTQQQLDARESAQCANYGFHPGTEGFAGCLQRLDMAQRQAAHDDLNRSIERLTTPPPVPIPMMPIPAPIPMMPCSYGPCTSY